MKAIPPVLLERQCDGGRSEMDASDIVRYAAEMTQERGEAFMLLHPYYPGCGTRFQWYWGMNSVCPMCGRIYQVMKKSMDEGEYAIQK